MSDDPFSAFKINFKTFLYEKKENFQEIALGDLPGIVASWEPHYYERGAYGIYVSPEIRSPNDEKHLWLHLDVEHPEKKHHHDIARNIEIAQGIYVWLAERGLTDGIQIILSGHGFRLLWPFLVPPALTKAFKAWATSMFGVDAAILNRSPQRVFVHRGHTGRRRQDKGKNPPNIHTHQLADPSSILNLDAGYYRALVAGRISHSDTLKWLPKVLPNQLIPPRWFDFLNGINQQIRSKCAIVQFPRSERNTADILGQARRALDGMGIRYEESPEFSGIQKLSRCPICGRTDQKSFVGGDGRLRDWHTSCDAGQRNDSGKIIGIAPEEWMPDYREGYDFPEPETTNLTRTVKESRELIAEAVSSPWDTLCDISPGGGKTGTCWRTILPFCAKQRVIFAVPTLKKAKELHDEILDDENAAELGVVPVFIRGRTKGSKKEDYADRNCDHADECNLAASQGYKPAHVICPECPKSPDRKPPGGGKNPDICGYWSQLETLKSPGLFIMTHAKAISIKKPVDVLIFDEDPTERVLDTGVVSLDEVMDFERGGSVEVREAFRKFHVAASEGRADLERRKREAGILYHSDPPSGCCTIAETGGMTPKDIDLIGRHIAAYQQLILENGKLESERAWHQRLYREKVNMKTLRWLLIFLGEEKGSATLDISASERRGGSFRMSYHLRNIPKLKEKGRIIILDGTSHRESMNRLFRRDFRLVEAKIDLSHCHFVWIRQATGKTRISKRPDQALRALIKKSREYLLPIDRKILYSTHKDFRDKVDKIVKELVPATEGFQTDIVHYKGSRGVNTWEGFDAYVGLTLYTEHPVETWKRATALFPDDPQKRDEYIRHVSESENIQNLHRVRPALHRRTIILCGREWLPGLPKPDEIVDLRRGGVAKAFTSHPVTEALDIQAGGVDQAYQRARAFVEAFGFFTKHIGWHLGIGCEREKCDVAGYHRGWIKNVQKSDPFFIKYNNKEKVTLFEKNSILIFPKNETWNTIFSRLHSDFPDLPKLQSKQGNPRNEWTTGIGAVAAVRAFYSAMGQSETFRPEKWREVEPESTETAEETRPKPPKLVKIDIPRSDHWARTDLSTRKQIPDGYSMAGGWMA